MQFLHSTCLHSIVHTRARALLICETNVNKNKVRMTVALLSYLLQQSSQLRHVLTFAGDKER